MKYPVHGDGVMNTLTSMGNDMAMGAVFGFTVLGGAAIANISFSWLFGTTITNAVAGVGIGDGQGLV